MSSITFLAFESEAALETQPLLRAASASTFSSWASISVSNRDTVPELAAVLSSALLPMTALIAGSRESPSWINKSRTPHYAKHKHKPSRREASDEKTLCRDRPGVQDLRRGGEGLERETLRDVRFPDECGEPHKLRREAGGRGEGPDRGVRCLLYT